MTDRIPGQRRGPFRVTVNDLRRRLNDRAAANRKREADRQAQRNRNRVVEVLGFDPATGLVTVRLTDGSLRQITQDEAIRAGLLRPRDPRRDVPRPKALARPDPIQQNQQRRRRASSPGLFAAGLGDATFCFIYARFVGTDVEFWEHRVLADKWRKLGSVSWGLTQLSASYPDDPFKPNWVLTSPVWIDSARGEDYIHGQTAYVVTDDRGVELVVSYYEPYTNRFPLSPIAPRFWRDIRELGSATGLPGYIMAAPNIVTIPVVSQQQKGIQICLLSPRYTDVSSVIFSRVLITTQGPLYGAFRRFSGVVISSDELNDITDIYFYSAGNASEYLSAIGTPVPPWASLAVDPFYGIYGMGYRPPLSQVLSGTSVIRSQWIQTAGTQQPSTGSLYESFANASTAGYCIGKTGVMGRVLFTYGGIPFAADLQSQLSDPHGARAINGIEAFRDQARQLQLTVADPGTLPPSDVDQLNGRTVQFGHPDWAMDGTWWPCASAYW